MLQEWYALPDVTRVADRWFRECGPEHFEEHREDLERFVHGEAGTGEA